MNDDILLYALGAAVLLGGFGLGGLAKPFQPVGDGVGKLAEGFATIPTGAGTQGPIGWLIPDFLERSFENSMNALTQGKWQ